MQFSDHQSFQFSPFLDSDWGYCLDAKKSRSGYCIFFGDCLISWKTKKQSMLTKSTTKTEYRAVATTVAKVMWTSYVLKDFDILYSDSVILHCDNKSTIQILCNPTHHEKTKHIGINCHFARHHISSSFIKPSYVPSFAQLVKVITKPLGPSSFK